MTGIEKALIEAAEVIGYARDFIDGYIDVVDGDYGVPRPNKAMQLAQRLDEAMSLIDAAMNDPALTSPICPRPVNTAPEGKTAADCIRDGECGCDLSHRQGEPLP